MLTIPGNILSAVRPQPAATGASALHAQPASEIKLLENSIIEMPGPFAAALTQMKELGLTAMPDSADAVGDGKILPQGGKVSPFSQPLSLATVHDGGSDAQPAKLRSEPSEQVSAASLLPPQRRKQQDHDEALAAVITVQSLPQTPYRPASELDRASGVHLAQDPLAARGGTHMTGQQISRLEGSNSLTSAALPSSGAQENPDGLAGGTAVSASSDADAVAMPLQTGKTVQQVMLAGHSGNHAIAAATISAERASRRPDPDSATDREHVTAALDRVETQRQPGGERPLLTIGSALANRQEWVSQLQQHVRWMSANHIKAADIRLEPASLGPLEIKLTMKGDETHISFVTHAPVVRDALTDSVANLRDELDLGEGQTLDVNIDLARDAYAGEDGQAQSWKSGTAVPDDMQEASDGDIAMLALAKRQGIVDVYA